MVYRDDRLVAVNKPAGLHVHPSPMDRGETALTDILEPWLGQKVYPVHRLDRPTAGVLVFALDSEAAGFLAAAFRERRVDKTYWAVVRGWLEPTNATFPVQRDAKVQEFVDAETDFRPLEHYEAPWPRRGFDTWRFSLVEAKPVTGRRHQIRQHCDDLRHPILGDTVWGDTSLHQWLAPIFGDAGHSWGGLHLWCRQLMIPRIDGEGQLVLSAPLGSRDENRLEWYRSFRISNKNS